MANSTSKKPAAKAVAKPKVEKPVVEEPKVEVSAEPVVEEEVIEEPVVEPEPEAACNPNPEVVEEPAAEEEAPVEEKVEEEKEAPKSSEEIKDGDVYIHNILGTENSKWEVRRKTDKGYKVLAKYAYEKAKNYASKFGPVREA